MPKKIDDQKNIKNELDEILNEMKSEGRTEDIKAFSALKENNVYKVVSLDYNTIKKNAEIQAAEHVDAIVKFYLNGKSAEDKFLVHKMNRDKFRLAKQIVQLEIAEHSIAKLNEEIDNGNYNPRLWEVMGSLMKSFDGMNITYAKMEILIENNYKTIQEEIEYKNTLSLQTGTISNFLSDGVNTGKSIGHKNLLQSIKNSNNNVDEVEFLDITQSKEE